MPTGGSTRPVQVARGRGSRNPGHRRSRPHLGKGRCPQGAARLQRSAFGGSDAQAHTALLRPHAHTGLPVLRGGGHPADAGNRTRMRPDMFGRSAERDRHVCPSRRGQARLLTRLPGAPPCAGHWGPRWWRCWRPEPLLQPSPVPAPAPPPHGPQVGQRHRPPGVPLPRTGLGGPAAGGHRGLAGERTEGGWGSGDQPPAAGPTGRRADAPSAVSPSPCSSSCRQDPSQPDHPGDPGLRP